MQKIVMLLIAFMSRFGIVCCQDSTGASIIEDFERPGAWRLAPWKNASNGSSVKTAAAAHSGSFGLRVSDELFYRTDKVLGTPGQVISWWIRFENPSRAYCGFGITNAPNGFFLCIDPSTSTLHFSRSPDYTYPLLKSTSQKYEMKVWYRAEVKFNAATSVTGKLYGADGRKLLNSITVDIPALTVGGIAFSGPNFVQVDDIQCGIDSIPILHPTRFAPRIGERIVLKDVLFENDRSILVPSSYKELDRLVNYLKLNPGKKVEISGHTDSMGNEEHNKTLSEQRAKSVADYLIRNGIDKSHIEYAGFGSLKPIASNATEEGRKRNRRVEFVIGWRSEK